MSFLVKPSCFSLVSKPTGVGRVNRWTKHSAERLEHFYSESLAVSRNDIDLVFNEEIMKSERLTETHENAGIDPEKANGTKKQLAKITFHTSHPQVA